jgi:flagellar M-ring protein FliF
MELPPSPSSDPIVPPPGVLAQLSGFWAKTTRRQRLVIGGVTLAFVVSMGFVLAPDAGERHAVLFSGLSAADAGRVVQELQAQKIPYNVDADGSVITVPESQVHETRISLATTGMPNGSVGFELFDKQGFGTTSFVEQLNYRRALEGELSRTITALDPVERARVHISMGERSLYKADDQPPSASVMLSLSGGGSLSKEQAKGIVNLVSASVAGLSPDQVTVVDQRGNALLSADEDANAVEQQGDLEQTLSRRIERILEPVVGAGHVAVTVTAKVDTSQNERTEEVYEQSPDNVALRSESRTLEGAGGSVLPSGVAGAKGNLPGAPAPKTEGETGDLNRLVETKNYEVNHVVSHTVGPKAEIRRLHVAVLVDEPLDENGEPVSRTETELGSIAKLATEAAGLDTERGDRIEVHSVPFVSNQPIAEEPLAEAEATSPLPIPLEAAIGIGILVLGALGFLVLRRGRRKKNSRALVPAMPMTVRQLEREMKEAQLTQPAALTELAPSGAHARALAASKADAKTTARIVAGWLAEPATGPGRAA